MPPALVAPRDTRGTPRSSAACPGPRPGPPCPPAPVAPRDTRGTPRSSAACPGPRPGPPCPPALLAPRDTRGTPRSSAACPGPRPAVVTRITDRLDERIDDYRALRDSDLRARGIFVVEGRLAVLRLLQSPRFSTRSILTTEAALERLRDPL